MIGSHHTHVTLTSPRWTTVVSGGYPREMHLSHWFHSSLALLVIGGWGISLIKASDSGSGSELDFTFEPDSDPHHPPADDGEEVDDGAQVVPSNLGFPISLQEFLEKYPDSRRDPLEVMNSLLANSEQFQEMVATARQLCSLPKAKHAPPSTEETDDPCDLVLTAVSDTVTRARIDAIAVLVFYGAQQLHKDEVQRSLEMLSDIEVAVAALDRKLPRERRLHLRPSSILRLPLGRDECRPPFNGVLSEPGLVCVDAIAKMSVKLVRFEELLAKVWEISKRSAKKVQKLLHRDSYNLAEAAELRLATEALRLLAELPSQMADFIGILRNPELDLTTLVFFQRMLTHLQTKLKASCVVGEDHWLYNLRAYFVKKYGADSEIAKLWDLQVEIENRPSIPKEVFHERFVVDPVLMPIAAVRGCALNTLKSTDMNEIYNELGIGPDASAMIRIDATLINKWVQASKGLKSAAELGNFLETNFDQDLGLVEEALRKNEPIVLINRYLSRRSKKFVSDFKGAWGIVRSIGLFLSKLESKLDTHGQAFELQPYLEAYQRVAGRLMEQAAFDLWDEKLPLPLMDRTGIVRTKRADRERDVRNALQ